MNLSLYQKLAVSLVVIFCFICALVYSWSKQLELTSKHHGEQNLHLALAEHLVQDNPLIKEGVYDYAALENLFHTLMLLGPAFEFYFVDENGKILTYSAEPGKVKRTHINLPPLKKLINNPAAAPIYGDDPRNKAQQKIFSVAPVFNNDKLQGYLYVIIGGEAYDTSLNTIKNNDKLWLAALWLGAALAFLLIAMLILLRFFTNPIQRLARDVSNIEAANYSLTDTKLSNYSTQKSNEVHSLGRNIQAMVTRIDEQFKALEQSDKQRKELLTHLSHDLRTPLASLQGFLEVLNQSGAQLSAQEQREYLHVSLNNCAQLKQLIEQIFELAHLENGEISIHKETFNLGELIYDCIAKFSLTAEKKGLNLTVEPAICDFPVVADIAKLERVLSNLIDNAIRHTPKGGSIAVNVKRIDEKQLFVQVSDTGVGIKHDELNAIFNPHYQASNSNNEGRQQGGLGLAICKGLLKLMDSEINVQSELGKGTMFSFNLPQKIKV
ncbi:HAMP domain-containing sensor histidine kinase [Pseudoalteromonas sp. CST5]|uniref:sensor histidine kinase n=1 Tax=unclassified Pseudoalteromonas TaxID=194690 RepID=UPI0023586B13|nr:MULTISPECIES: HAMP domain-containing sensor histidine kinase [unclassified Pseudoalteromonas]MDC9514651.1 HAMP domain-containing sensor histidine kinase [Pseudoalteromonas sp. CST1]MDC9539093.1 HAMP domain-containing sensor histidine kinase [Pseudoalteromonas sp. CST3]MDC9543213.1 HAMP domain-containing sensor histidine kinase [Pseudoalteromonas sp. CST2]MDC9545971.1 HAMP domain-containing sensor histidine kinase [Pseudoalteromonas sp. CST4]MDC9550823.1 HAMP domain-containing sensor histidi